MDDLNSLLRLVKNLISNLCAALVPVGGIFLGGWSKETIMLVYLLENLVLIFFSSLHIWWLAPAYESLPGKKPTTRREMLQNYWIFTLSFSLAISLFMAMMLFLFKRIQVSWSDIEHGILWIIAFQAANLLGDLLLRRRLSHSQAWDFLNYSMGRVALLVLGFMIGFPLAMFGAFTWFAVPFITLKIFVDTFQPLSQLVARLRGRQPAGSSL
jgi:Family of unknown function (DUF6498)